MFGNLVSEAYLLEQYILWAKISAYTLVNSYMLRNGKADSLRESAW